MFLVLFCFCDLDHEIIYHLILDCSYSRNVWLLVADGAPLSSIVALDDDTFGFKVLNFWKRAGYLEICLNIGWVVWLNRNKCHFDLVCSSYLSTFRMATRLDHDFQLDECETCKTFVVTIF